MVGCQTDLFFDFTVGIQLTRVNIVVNVFLNKKNRIKPTTIKSKVPFVQFAKFDFRILIEFNLFTGYDQYIQERNVFMIY